MLSLFAFVCRIKEGKLSFSLVFIGIFYFFFRFRNSAYLYTPLVPKNEKFSSNSGGRVLSLGAITNETSFSIALRERLLLLPFCVARKILRMKTCGFLHFIDMFRLLSPFARSAVPMYGDVRANEDFRSKPEEPRRADPPFAHSSCASHYGGGGTSLASDGEGGTSRGQMSLSVTFGDSSPKGRAFLSISER